MRTIDRTGQFRRDYKREAKDPHRQMLQGDFAAIITALANDLPLAEKHRDHALTGYWKVHRDCHIKPDLVLIYRKPDAASIPMNMKWHRLLVSPRPFKRLSGRYTMLSI